MRKRSPWRDFWREILMDTIRLAVPLVFVFLGFLGIELLD